MIFVDHEGQAYIGEGTEMRSPSRTYECDSAKVIVLQKVGADWKVSTHTWNYDRPVSRFRHDDGRGYARRGSHPHRIFGRYVGLVPKADVGAGTARAAPSGERIRRELPDAVALKGGGTRPGVGDRGLDARVAVRDDELSRSRPRRASFLRRRSRMPWLPKARSRDNASRGLSS
jgi:hypothetical protein